MIVRDCMATFPDPTSTFFSLDTHYTTGDDDLGSLSFTLSALLDFTSPSLHSPPADNDSLFDTHDELMLMILWNGNKADARDGKFLSSMETVLSWERPLRSNTRACLSTVKTLAFSYAASECQCMILKSWLDSCA